MEMDTKVNDHSALGANRQMRRFLGAEGPTNSWRESVPMAGWPDAVFQERPILFQSYFFPGGAVMAPIFYAIVQAVPGLLI
jgi:hypothetical protein